ncbi:YqgE/AlgH family protein, partial [Klebsiella pneumoniae]|uniref:YqgE/AlgH family protein n=1 Tax=Klebsiella pneumoniae TaxID=573 RepID=UPI003854A583
AIARGAGPAQWLVALGYAGWGAGQLDGEMRQHGWYAAQGRAGIVFEKPRPKPAGTHAGAPRGSIHRIWSPQPGGPEPLP